MCNLEEFEMVEAALICFESSSDGFHLSPDINEGFGLSGSTKKIEGSVQEFRKYLLTASLIL